MELRKFPRIFVELECPLHETAIAIQHIHNLKKKNDIDFDLTIAYDFTYDGQGYYLPRHSSEKIKHTIYINPANCEYNNPDDETSLSYAGFLSDFSIFGITIHEFAHFLTYAIYPKIRLQYRNAFPKERLYLNPYANTNLNEEIAEVLSLYLTNPYLLNLISKPHCKFFKTFFKSPVPCSLAKGFEIYTYFPVHIKRYLLNKWGIDYNVRTRRFEKHNIIWNVNNEYTS